MSHPSFSQRRRSKSSTRRRSGPSARGGKGSASSTATANRSTSDFSRVQRAVTGLSDRGLLNATARLAKTERLTTLEILVHLNEVEKRELYLGLGCGSMFDYCVSQLGYSRSAAGRRLPAARCLGRFPEMYDLVETNELNLTTLSLIASVLTKENKTELLRQVCGKSQEEVNEILAAYRPAVAFRDRVTPVRVAVPVSRDPAVPTSAGSWEVDDLGLKRDKRGAAKHDTKNQTGISETQRVTAPDGNASPKHSGGTVSCSGGATAPPRYKLETRLRVDFATSKQFMAKYQEAQALLSNTLQKLSFETVFNAALDAFLDKHSPARRRERRKKRAADAKKNHGPEKQPRRTAQSQVRARRSQHKDAHHDDGETPLAAPTDQLSRKNFDGQSRCGTLTRLNSSSELKRSQSVSSTDRPDRSKTKKQPTRSRHISAKTRDAVFVRDKNRCTHIGSNGKRCESTYRLHIDHIVPYARGGTHALSNLRLLCAKHNTLEAKRVYGAAKMDSHRKRE